MHLCVVLCPLFVVHGGFIRLMEMGVGSEQNTKNLRTPDPNYVVEKESSGIGKGIFESPCYSWGKFLMFIILFNAAEED